MAGEDAGSIYAEIRVALDKLQADVKEVHTAFRNVEKATDSIKAAEIRLKTNKLEEDIKKAKKLYDELAQKAQQEGMTPDLQLELDKVTVDISKYNKELDNIKNKVNGVKDSTDSHKISLENLKQTITAVSTAYLAAKSVITTVIGLFKSFFDKMQSWNKTYTDHQAELQKLNAVLNTTGAVAWTTAGRLDEMANKLSRTTNFMQNDIMKAQGVLLGFKNITGETFERTTKALLDMTTVMGGDLSSAANILGKAIDTPVQGMTALSRQGFVFTEQEKAMVKQLVESGDTLKAQGFILTTVENAFAGAAVAVATTTEAIAANQKAQEELDKARGRQTDSLVKFFNLFRAGEKNLAADIINMRESAKEAKKWKKQIDELNLELEAQRRNVSNLTEAQKENMNNPVVKHLRDLEMQYARLNNEVDRYRYEIALLEEKKYDLERTSPIGSFQWMQNLPQLQDIKMRIESLKLAAKNREDAALAAASAEKALLDQQIKDSNNFIEQENKRNDIIDKRNHLIAIAEDLYKREAINADQYYSQIVSAYTEEVNAFEELFQGAMKLDASMETRLEIQNLTNGALNEAIRLQNQWAKAAENRGMTEREFLEERQKILDAYEQKVTHLNNMRDARQITEKDYEDQIIQLQQTRLNSLDDLIARARCTAEEAPKTYGMIIEYQTELNNKLKERRDLEQKANENKWIKEYTLKIESLNASRERQLEIEQELALDRLRDSDLYINATEDVRKEMERLLVASMQLKDEGSPFETWMAGMSNAMKGMQELGNLFTTIWNDVNKEALKDLEDIYKEEQKMIEEFYDRKLDLLEQDYQNQLYYAGLGKASTAEHFEADLEKAIATGNHKLVYQRERERKEFEIQQEHERKKKEAEDKANEEKELAEQQYQRRKAEIEHRAAMQQWGISLAMTTASVAQAIMQAYAQLGPLGGIAGAALMGTIGAIQTAAVAAAKPKLQAFAEGGIVEGNPYRGDVVPIMARGEEMMLTKQDQAELLNMIRNGGSTEPIIIHNTIELDGDVFVDFITETISRGNSFIRNRGIIR